MNQNFGFMEELIPKIISGEKYLTNRAYSRSRKKCRPGDTMHIFKKFRTPEIEKICDAKVINQFIWSIDKAPKTFEKAIRKSFHDIKGKNIQLKEKSNPNWFDFCIADGFVDYKDFYDYFSDHPKETRIFICYIFERIDYSKMFHSILEYMDLEV